MRRLSTLLVVLVACSSQTTIPNTTPPVSTQPAITTTSAPTTTAAPLLAGAPPAWQASVADVYGFPCGGNRSTLPTKLQSLVENETCPSGGESAMAEVGGAILAVATIGRDVIYGVDSGSGFQVVAAVLPSLGLDQGWYGNVPKLVAVVGSDARPGEDAGTSRADSLHLVGLDGAGSGGVVGIPRDSWVSINGGRENKINAALSSGGPESMLSTLIDVSELALDGIVVTGFEGFVEMWDGALGGAEVDVPLAIQDQAAKADLEQGIQVLDGTQALAFSRTRKTLAGGDLTRQLHGGIVLLGALHAAQLRGPLDLPMMMALSEAWLVTDMGWPDLMAWSALALATPVDGIPNKVVPARIGSVGSASVVFLTSEAPAVFADLADGAVAP